ncbi:PhnD/SsuA/transferrin family substrate-binding protein [Mycoplasma yeatsii]|uniref:PhnD/SsuA/transferrin family substrate-binding protein n=1 Tax=Mycoplasma yeatsii TaxID=51365 RepID=UPI0005B24BA0|nr:PhnD/SsuA/transferrin family substrate-binding protein [Mycoplasma yeatsii]AJM72223.1 putative phosphonate ABC transporter substrate-binding lipoprotein [Mycoplasma yeatsii GM274B]
MKKLISIISSIGLVATSSLAVVSCRTPKLEILFVPSRSGTDITAQVAPLRGLLTKKLKELAKARGEEFNKAVKVDVSTSYSAAAKSLAGGSVDIALMSIQPYAENRGEKQEDGTYDKIGFLLSSGRRGAKPYTTFEGFQGEDKKFSNDKAISDLKGEDLFGLANWYQKYATDHKPAEGKSYATILEDDTIPASYYRSYVYANTSVLSQTIYKDQKSYKAALDEAKQSNNFDNYKQIIKSLLLESNIKIALGDKKSSAGFSYPVLWMKETAGLTNEQIVDLFKNGKKFIKGSDYDKIASTIGDNAEAKAGNGYAIGFGFSDIRFTRTGKLDHEKKLFENTEIIGASQAIINDGIMYSKNKKSLVGKDLDLLKDIKTGLLSLIKEDKEAKKVFSIYNITNFVEPDATKIDSDITDSLKKLDDVSKIANAITWA